MRVRTSCPSPFFRRSGSKSRRARPPVPLWCARGWTLSSCCMTRAKSPIDSDSTRVVATGPIGLPLSDFKRQTGSAPPTAEAVAGGLDGGQDQLQSQIEQIHVGHRDGHLARHHHAFVEHTVEDLANRNSFAFLQRA